MKASCGVGIGSLMTSFHHQVCSPMSPVNRTVRVLQIRLTHLISLKMVIKISEMHVHK